MKRKTLAVAAVALLATVGTASVLSARGGWHEGGGRHGWHHERGGMMDGGMMGMRENGMFGGGPGMRGFGKLRRSDADKDGVVTLDEFLKEPSERFAKLDKNGDGTLDADELVAPMREGIDYRIRAMTKRFDANGDGKVTKDDFATRARERFAERDITGDGTISSEDMPPRFKRGKWRDRLETRTEEPRTDAGDNESDEAQSGMVDDDDDFRGRHGRRGGWGWKSATVDDFVKRAERRFERMDTNNDGVLNAADIEARVTPMLDFAKKKRMHSLDKDKDGKVTKEEFLARPKKHFAMFDLDGDGKITVADLPPRMAERWGKNAEDDSRR